jgi:uncharacterized protein YjeT (DUF2065 family)
MEIWHLILPALGLAMFLEGLPYFVSPPAVRRFMRLLETMSDGALRIVGLCLMVGGLALAFVFTR